MLVVFVLLTTISITVAGQDWKSTVKDPINNLVSKIEKSKTIYIFSPVDATREGLYYPFLATVQAVITSAVLDNDLKVDPVGLSNDYSLSTRFRVVDQGLELVLSLLEGNSDSVISTRIVELTPDLLPETWNVRTLQDIAYEVVGKLHWSKLRFRTGVPVVLEEFLGGTTDDDSYISEFAIVMLGYLQESLGRSTTFRPVTNEKAHADNIRPYRLKGHYQVNAPSAIVRLRLFESDSTTEVSNVSSTFSASLIPSTLDPLPPNQKIASESIDADNYEIQKIELKIWVNKAAPAFEHGDKLIVSLLPTVDLYARVYYVDSKGEVCQIFPRRGGGDGFLSGGKIREIGNTHVEMTIDASETWGQESIKAFTSDVPIDDSAVPKEKHSGCTKKYKAVSRGIKLKSIVRLAAETIIFVRSQ